MTTKAAALLNNITNVCIVVTSILLCVTFAKTLVTPQTKPRPPLMYSVGDLMDQLPSINYSDSERTLLIFAASTCQFCSASMPFYRSLVDSDTHGRRGFRLVVAGPEPQEVLRKYLETNGVLADHVLTVSPGRVKVTGTPTLVVVDRYGKVAGAWMGHLDKAGETAVRMLLTG